MSEQYEIARTAIQATFVVGLAAVMTNGEPEWPTQDNTGSYSVAQSASTFSERNLAPTRQSDPQEDDFKLEMASVFASIADNQEPLGKEFEDIWDNNAESLYEA